MKGMANGLMCNEEYSIWTGLDEFTPKAPELDQKNSLALAKVGKLQFTEMNSDLLGPSYSRVRIEDTTLHSESLMPRGNTPVDMVSIKQLQIP
ncbi:hypothetical protein D5086_032228 [Populus alba]|uniref:Uncharacterized protein n=1 Tax=Populus alba TaxID=43335 RepID=A0ACC4AKT4_POPAL